MYAKKAKNNLKIYHNIGETKDNRVFDFGSIWQIRDELINIPNADRINQRKYHFSRCIVIVDNSEQNWDENSPVIAVVPISSKVKFERRFDIVLDEEKDGVLEDSIIMLDYIQPVLKKDLYKCVGEISIDKKHELYEAMSMKMGISSYEESAVSNDLNEKND